MALQGYESLMLIRINNKPGYEFSTTTMTYTCGPKGFPTNRIPLISAKNLKSLLSVSFKAKNLRFLLSVNFITFYMV